jgi:hypothetical protein
MALLPDMPSVYCGDPRSIEVMRTMDERVTPEWRSLMHEYGFVIVAKMLDEGYRNAAAARDELEIWRDRQQERWLRTDFVGKSTRDAIMTYIRRRPRRARNVTTEISADV